MSRILSVNDSSQKSGMAVGEISVCLSCHDIVALHRLICNMTYVPVLLIRSDFQIGILGITCICFDVSRREDYDGVSRFSLSFVVEKLLKKTLILLKATLLFNLP